MTSTLRRLRLGALLCGLALLAGAEHPVAAAPADLPAPAALPATETGESFRLYTDRAGAHEVRFEELVAGGLAGEVDSSKLALTNLGQPVPIWVEDGGDGRFGPGDRFEFVAARLAGARAYHHEYSRFNVFTLTTAGAAGGARMHLAEARAVEGGEVERGARSGWRRTVHLERDRLLARISVDDLGPPNEHDDAELWFWEKLTHLDRERLEIPLGLTGLDPERRDPVLVEARFRGLSSQPEAAIGASPDRQSQARQDPAQLPEAQLPEAQMPGAQLPDHQVDFALASRRLDSTTWDGRTEHSARLAPIPARRLAAPSPAADSASLFLRVPRRRAEGAADPVIDVVMLNWIELDYPHDGEVAGEQVALRWVEPSERPVVVGPPAGLTVYGDDGSRTPIAPGAPAVLATAGAEGAFRLVPAGTLHSPAAIERDPPSDLRSADRQADYLMIAHGSLLEEARRLADHHRATGLAVALVDVQDVYDEFNHGVVHPRAIRDFIAHAHARWAEPQPRYVLLVGDASWDTKNVTADDALYANWVDQQLLAPDDFRAKEIESYEETERVADRNLIPTHNFHTREGHAASDNWFVAVEGDDVLPDLAIGRLPVATPATLRGLVDKLVRYAAAPPAGDWRRQILWITNEWEWLQNHSREIDEEIEGFASQRVFPSADEPTNEHHQAVLTDAFNEGRAFVHFAGHGGRFIWRTAPRDLSDKNVDLFTLEHVEALEPNDKLPVVFSMTCHSGPFDHPTADSIAERFLRLPNRGAIAVISASWRTSAASVWLSRALMLEFTKGGRIGDAFLRAKRRMEVEDLIATYNLFGDPALPLAVPAEPLAVRLADEGSDLRPPGP